MDDLNQQINQILSDPQSMKQLQDMAAALGLGGTSQAPSQAQPQAQSQAQPAGGFDPTALAGMLSSLGLGQNQPQSPPPAPSPPAPANGVDPHMLQAVTKLAPLLSQVNREDDSTRLLRALRPLLGPVRQKKLDEAIKILQMMRLLPLLKDSGLFSGLLSGLL